MFKGKRIQTAGIFGMFGAGLFFVGLLIEYRYGLFPPGSGALYIINQIMFLVAMSCLWAMLWGMRAAQPGGSGRFARFALTGFPIAWAMILLAGFISLFSGSNDNLLYPLGGVTTVIFSLLTGIAVVRSNKWSGWTRFAPLLLGLYYLLLLILLVSSIEPFLLSESLWMGTWFLTSLALFVNERRAVAIKLA